MGLLDKAKAQAEQALAKAQHGMVQGQARLDQMQSKRQADALLHSLGAAYYAQERQGGTPEAVSSAFVQLDDFVAQQGPIDAMPSGSPPAGSGAGAPGGGPAGQQAPAAPAGDFTLGDM